jgi:DNA-binding CsgD family transcriptional regulator
MHFIDFSKLLKIFSEFSIFSQKGKGKISTIQKKSEFNIKNFLKTFSSFEVYSYVLVDVTELKIVEVGKSLKQLTGYDPDYFEGKGYHKFIKIHSIQDIIRSIYGGIKFYQYLYKQKKENRPYIKAIRTLYLYKKDGSKIFVMVQGIPVVFNDQMEVVLLLLICTDITQFQAEHKYSHYIIDSSDSNEVKKIIITDPNSAKESSGGPSPAEKNVLNHLSNGLSSKQIATKLFISEHTVRSHRKNMLRKFECTSSSELVRKALINGWI